MNYHLVVIILKFVRKLPCSHTSPTYHIHSPHTRESNILVLRARYVDPAPSRIACPIASRIARPVLVRIACLPSSDFRAVEWCCDRDKSFLVLKLSTLLQPHHGRGKHPEKPAGASGSHVTHRRQLEENGRGRNYNRSSGGSLENFVGPLAQIRSEPRDPPDVHWQKVCECEYAKSDYYTIAEETYLNQKTAFLDILSNLRRHSDQNEGAPARSPDGTVRKTLPRIQQLQFSGAYEAWLAFRDLFQSMVDKDSSLQHVERLHFLKTRLKGEAGLLLQELATTAENYSRAWMLIPHYIY